MNMTRTVDLTGKDAAIVLREDGEHAELYYPSMEDPTEILPTNVVVLLALSLRLKNKDFVDELLTWFSAIVKENEKYLKDIHDKIGVVEVEDTTSKTLN
jgi:hypothetical protein